MRQCTAFVGNCCERLYECVSSVCLLICCCCRGKKACATSETRLIKVDMVEEGSRKKHNKIKTSKYSLLTFLPKNLVEQFHRVVNFYFLIITIITIVIDSPIAPWTCVVPLSFMVLVSGLKQGYEDWLRHRSDDRVNNKIVEIVHKGVVKEVRNSSIAPGTLVRVKRGREVPADLVLLCCAGESGRCHVTTANLDGETNLKTLRVPPPLIAYTPDSLPGGLQIEVPNPIPDLYTFYGRLEIPSHDSLGLCSDNLMLRGSRVKNTDWAIGCAVYTGEETKLALNSKYSGNKFSSCELTVNEFVVYFIILLLLEILVAFVVKMMLQQNNPEHKVYLGPGESFPLSIGNIFQDLLSFMVLYYYIIPMSLYVTIELFKFIGALFVGWDEDLRCQETGRPAVANTSNLIEELGQVEVLFSDKTGTLTKNIMIFKACSIKGDIYEENDSKFYYKNRYEEPVDTTQTAINFFFTILALCHSVQISSDDMKRLSAKMSISGNLQLINFFRRKKLISMVNNKVADNVTWNNISEIGSKMDYQASSPDEKALVEAADRVGVTFLGEDGNNLLVKIGEQTEIYERLQLIEFTSERKRMSVIVQDKKGKIWLFCKGAESAVFPICKNKTLVEDINNDINSFANKGLRTLAIAYREVPQGEYKEISEAIKKIDGTNAESLQNITKLYRKLEKDLTLVGATAVEDCLQDDVADTLAALRRAGIRIWVLTGDKVETAISVAQSCAHISENDKRMFLTGVQDATSLQARLDECLRVTHEPGYRDLTLVVDGSTMSLILDSPAASIFVDISLKCNAVLCCRLSPLQKAKIVKLIKNSPERPITAAIGDGANDISMIQEAHVGFGIFGKEGHQAARSADYAFTKFSMVKKVLLVLGHWYYQRLTLLIHYFFYKNLVLGNIMFIFGAYSMFSTQSIFDSMFLAFYNTLFTAIPCLILSVTDQRWPANFLLNNPILYRNNSKNKLMTTWHFLAWCLTATYHSVIIFMLSKYFIINSVINADGKTVDLWCFGVILIHFLVLIVNLELWLQARYHTLIFVVSVIGSLLAFVLFSFLYTLSDINVDGDISGTYIRIMSSASFGLLNIVMVVAALVPELVIRLLSEKWERRRIESTTSARSIFVTKL